MLPTVDPTLAAAILDETIEHLTQGWAQKHDAHSDIGAPCDSNDSAAVAWCTLGALEISMRHQCGRALVEDRIFYRNTYDALSDALAEQISGKSGCFFDVIQWNDTPGRTQTEVIQLVEGLRAKILSER